MKKMIYFLKKKKKSVEISSSIASDAVPDPPRNIPHYVPKLTDLCDSFEVNCCVNNVSESNCVPISIQNEISEDTLQLNGYEENLSDEVAQPVEVEVERPPENDLAPEAEQLPVVCLSPESGNVSDSGSNRLDKTNDLNVRSRDGVHQENNALDNSAFGELNKTIQKLATEFKKKGMADDKKNNGSTYVITISNSAHFHIGSQKTINYPGADSKSNEKSQLQLTDIRTRKLLPSNDSQVLDIKDVLSEDDMLQISLSVREKWKDFARNLGADESTIRELEDLNDNDYNLVVYDILRQYLNRYPNTTVGYMIDVLRKSNEMKAIEKLLENR